MANWELKHCCNHEQVVFLTFLGVCSVVILALWRTVLMMPFKLITVFIHEASHAIACKLTCGHVEGIQVHADEGGATHTRGGVYWFILPAGYLGSSFWGMVLILASTNLLTARIAAGCLAVALVIVLFIAKNWTLRGLCIGFIIFIVIVWVLQETTTIRILRYIILFIGVMNSLFSIYDIYGDLISRRVHISDAEKFAEVCPCPCNGVGWGVIWGFISLLFLCAAAYLALSNEPFIDAIDNCETKEQHGCTSMKLPYCYRVKCRKEIPESILYSSGPHEEAQYLIFEEIHWIPSPCYKVNMPTF